MRIDIYLYRVDGVSIDEADRLEAEYRARCYQSWAALGGYSALTEDQRAEVFRRNRAMAAEMGLDEWGNHPGRAPALVPLSGVDRNHAFSLGYIGSDSSDDGFEATMALAGAPGLYQIFGRDAVDGPEFFRPDWEACRQRVTDAISAFERFLSAPGGNVRVRALRVPNANAHISHNPRGMRDALDVYRRQFGPGLDMLDESIRNNWGAFWPGRPLRVRGLVPGVDRGMFGGWVPAVYVVHEPEPKDDHPTDWHLRGLMIIREMIEFVLSRRNPQAYHLRWVE
jgi:hypothetical protein